MVTLFLCPQIGHSATDEGSSRTVQSDAQAGPRPGAGGEGARAGAGQEHHEQETKCPQPTARGTARGEARGCQGEYREFNVGGG